MRSCTHMSEECKGTIMVSIHVCVVRFICFRTHLWLNFDLKAAAEPTGLLQRRPCDPTHRLEDPLSHLLHDNVTVNITTVSHMHLSYSHSNTTYLQISCVLLILQVGEPIDKVIENSARQKLLMNIIIFNIQYKSIFEQIQVQVTVNVIT